MVRILVCFSWKNCNHPTRNLVGDSTFTTPSPHSPHPQERGGEEGAHYGMMQGRIWGLTSLSGEFWRHVLSDLHPRQHARKADWRKGNTESRYIRLDRHWYYQTWPNVNHGFSTDALNRHSYLKNKKQKIQINDKFGSEKKCYCWGSASIYWRPATLQLCFLFNIVY